MVRFAWILALLLPLPVLAGGDGGSGMAQAIDPERAPVATVDTRVDGSPLLRKPKLRAEYSVVIEAPMEEVWAYLGDSTKAHDWSTYFTHITPLDDLDGKVGSVRRCFVQADEQGRRWDERVVGTIHHELRHIRMFNLHGYPVPGHNKFRYDVWQLFEAVSPTQTKLTFRTAPAKGTGAGQWVVWLTSRRKTKRVFQLNLENIKAAIEQGERYTRLHPYDPD